MRTVNKESHLNPVTVTLLKSLFRALFWYMLVSWKIKQILMSSSSMLHLISWCHVPITSADWLPVLLKRVNGWMLFNPKWVIFQLYHGENSYIQWDDDDICFSKVSYNSITWENKYSHINVTCSVKEEFYTSMAKLGERMIIALHQVINFPAILWREQVTFLNEVMMISVLY